MFFLGCGISLSPSFQRIKGNTLFYRDAKKYLINSGCWAKDPCKEILMGCFRPWVYEL